MVLVVPKASQITLTTVTKLQEQQCILYPFWIVC